MIFFILLKTIISHPVRAAISIYWLCLGKRVRARNNLGVLITNVASRYRIWRRYYEDFSNDQKRQACIEMDDFSCSPHFLIVTDNYPSESLEESLKNQWYDQFTLISQSQIPDQKFDCYMHVKSDDRLAENALFELAKAFQGQAVRLVTFDDDVMDRSGQRFWPYFKPQWNKELQLSANYIGLSYAIRTSHYNKPSEAIIDFLLDDQKEETVHISKILRHMNDEKNLKANRGVDEFEQWVQKLAKTPYFKSHEVSPLNWLAPKLASQVKEKISIIIPTRDTLHFLRPCVESVLAKTSYDNYEILIIDNDSSDKKTLAYFESLKSQSKVKVISYPGPFNYSAINNFAVQQATGSYICLLNNDTKVISENWLGYLLAHATKAEVGAVGAKLLYADHTIQHAGVTTGLGSLAGHSHRFQRDQDVGYFNRIHQTQEVSVVTAACLLVSKEKFLSVNGLNEKDLTVAFNDVDFCLKLDDEGYKNIYEPNAVLYHYESKSRGKDLKGEKRKRYLTEVDYMQRVWKTNEGTDRYYSPNLTADKEDFSINIEPKRDDNV